MKTGKIIGIAVGVGLAGFITWKLVANKTEINERQENPVQENFTIPVKVQKVEQTNLTEMLALSGELQSAERVELIKMTVPNFT